MSYCKALKTQWAIESRSITSLTHKNCIFYKCMCSFLTTSLYMLDWPLSMSSTFYSSLKNLPNWTFLGSWWFTCIMDETFIWKIWSFFFLIIVCKNNYAHIKFSNLILLLGFKIDISYLLSEIFKNIYHYFTFFFIYIMK